MLLLQAGFHLQVVGMEQKQKEEGRQLSQAMQRFGNFIADQFINWDTAAETTIARG